MAQKLYDLTSLEIVCNGDVYFMNQMIKIIEDNAPNDLNEISLAIRKKDFKYLKRIVHDMRPSVNYICVESLSEDRKLIENWAGSNDVLIEKANMFVGNINIALAQLKGVEDVH